MGFSLILRLHFVSCVTHTRSPRAADDHLWTAEHCSTCVYCHSPWQSHPVIIYIQHSFLFDASTSPLLFSAVIKLRKTYIIYLRAGSRSGSVVHLLTLELIFSGDKWTYRFHKYFVISGLLRNECLTFSTQGPDPGPWLKWVLCGASERKMRFFFISQLVIRTVGEIIYHIATADFKS